MRSSKRFLIAAAVSMATSAALAAPAAAIDPPSDTPPERSCLKVPSPANPFFLVLPEPACP